MMNRCAVCKENYSSIWAKREHDASMIHHVRLQQASIDCEHVCRICKFICRELSEYSKHVDSSLHKDKLAQVRMRRAVFEDISDETELVPFDDVTRRKSLALLRSYLPLSSIATQLLDADSYSIVSVFIDFRAAIVDEMEREPQSKLEGAARCEERILLRRRPSERPIVNYREHFERGMNPHYRSSWREQGSAYAFTRGDAHFGQWYPDERSRYGPVPVEYSVPLRLEDVHRRDSSRELRYYNGAFRRGTPRPVNPCNGEEWLAEEDVIEMEIDQMGGGPKNFPPPPHGTHEMVPTFRRAALKKNKGSLPEGAPSVSQNGSSNSQVASSQPLTSVLIKKGFLRRFSLRGRSKTAAAASGNDNSETISHKKTHSPKTTPAVSGKEQSMSAGSASTKEGVCTDLPLAKKTSTLSDATSAIRKNTSERSKRTVGLALPPSSSLKADRTSKWEKVARKSRALFLKNRSQKMLKERLNKYRLVSTRGDPIPSDGVTMTGLTRRTSGVRLSDLFRSHNGSKIGVSSGTAHAMRKSSVNDKIVANTAVSGAQQVPESTLRGSMCTPHAPKSTNTADLSFTPFFEGADWKRVVKEANDASSVTSPSSSSFSFSTAIVAVTPTPVTTLVASSSPSPAVNPCTPGMPPKLLHGDAYDISTVSPTTNIEVGSTISQPESLCDSTVKIETEEGEMMVTVPPLSHTPCSSDAASSQSIGTSDVSIGDFPNSDFSCMDDDAKLKFMWTLVAKESSLNMSLNAVNEKLMKLRSEMVAVLNERNQIEKDIMEVRGTKSRLLQSAGGNHTSLHTAREQAFD